MAIDWAKARQGLTGNEAYRGTGKAWPSRRSRNYGATQGRGGQGNVWRPSTTSQRQPGIGAANVRPRSGGVWDAVKAKGKRITPWMADIAGKAGDLASGAMRGSRLHQSYQDELGRVAGHKEWEKDKRAMMTDKDQAFYDKYMNLASMAQDNEKAQYYRDQAETAWRNKQTSDRLAAIQGFEDYVPGKYTGVGEGSRYTGDVYKGQGRTGKHVPGVQIMRDLLGYGTEADDFNRPSDRQPGLDMYPSMDITDDLNIERKDKPPMPGADPYNPYRDEDYGAPLWDRGVQPHPNPLIRFGNLGINDPANVGFDLNMTEPYTPYRDEDYFDIDRTAGFGWSGDSRANALQNRGYDYDDQTGTIMPNISLEFTGDEEEESNKINPSWNTPKGRLGLYNK
jgi:hypothetical protein